MFDSPQFIKDALFRRDCDFISPLAFNYTNCFDISLNNRHFINLQPNRNILSIFVFQFSD